MTPSGDTLARAEQHVREAEARVARQVALLRRFYTPEGEQVLRALEESLAVMREHLRIERDLRGIRHRSGPAGGA